MVRMLSGCLAPRAAPIKPVNRIAILRNTSLSSGKRLSVAAARKSVARIPRRLRCAEVSGSPFVQKLNAVELESAIQDRTLPTIIDFYATWCGPCVLMSKELEKVAEQLKGEVRILKVDTDENMGLSSQLNIEGLPTLMFLSSDTAKKSLRLEGFIPAETVIKIIKEEL